MTTETDTLLELTEAVKALVEATLATASEIRALRILVGTSGSLGVLPMEHHAEAEYWTNAAIHRIDE